MKRKALLCLLSLLMVCMSIPMSALSVCAEETGETPTITLLWPVPGHTSLIRGYHDAKAIDIGDSSVNGANIVSACSGTVVSITRCKEKHPGNEHNEGTAPCYGLGTGVVILGDDNRYYQYGHMTAGSIPSEIRSNKHIEQGQLLGTVGETGNAEQPHLHFGITIGTAYAWSHINPENETYIYDKDDPTPPSTPEPTDAKITVDRERYKPTDQITISVSAKNAAYYFGMILKSGKTVWSGDMANGKYTCKASDLGTGSFTACAVCSNENGLIFTPVAAFIISDSTEFPFKDVSKTDWSYEWIKKAYDRGLIAGMSSDTFQPDGTLTYAQAITLAARLHQTYYEGASTLENGTVNWYDPYVEYCFNNGIIDEKTKNSGSSLMNTPIDRATFVGYFSKTMPGSEFPDKNTIPYGSIPDVTKATVNSDAIYLFYRSGILNGSDEKGSFKPYSSIRRSEVAAILIRMVDASCRVGAPAGF